MRIYYAPSEFGLDDQRKEEDLLSTVKFNLLLTLDLTWVLCWHPSSKKIGNRTYWKLDNEDKIKQVSKTEQMTKNQKHRIARRRCSRSKTSARVYRRSWQSSVLSNFCFCIPFMAFSASTFLNHSSHHRKGDSSLKFRVLLLLRGGQMIIDFCLNFFPSPFPPS